MYGIAETGGTNNYGVVFKLTETGNTWSLATEYSFAGPPSDGFAPSGGLTFDPLGNIYGTTANGGTDCGTIFQIVPNGQSWSEHPIYNFKGGSDGCFPSGTLVRNQQGNLFGSSNGAIFVLYPFFNSWVFNVLDTTCTGTGGMVMDSSGDLFGGCNGFAFKLSFNGHQWVLQHLHDFSGPDGSGIGQVVLDSNGNLFGTAFGGGPNSGCLGNSGLRHDLGDCRGGGSH